MQIITEAEIDNTLALAELQEKAQDVKPAIDFLAEFEKGHTFIPGEQLPWQTLRNRFWLRKGELTLWAGENGAGKSLLTGMAMSWIMPFNRVLIASMEMKPRETLLRMCQQAMGRMNPSIEAKRAWLKRTGEGEKSTLLIYDQLDTVPADRILAVTRIAGSTLGCTHIVIDSLTKCGLGSDDYTAQKRFVDRLQWIAKSTGAHIHLVCHLRKGESYGKEPTKWDIRGASEIVDLADNAVLMWRNRAKEKALEKRAARQLLKEAEEQALIQPDTFVRVDKQRHHSWEGAVGLWFERTLGEQFVCNPGHGIAYPVDVFSSTDERAPAMAEEDEL